MGRVTVLLAPMCLLALTPVPRAAAQYQAAAVNRPSVSSPSTQVETLGGRFTRWSRPQVQSLSPAVPYAGLPSLTMSPSPNRPGSNRPGGQSTPAPVKLGMVPSPNSAALFREGLLSEFNLGAATGFDISVSPGTPIYGWTGLNIPAGAGTPIEQPPSDGSAFHRFFALTPSEPALPDKPGSYETLIDRMDARNRDRLQELYKQAFHAFAEATVDDSSADEQKTARLQLARRLFGSAHDLTTAGRTDITAPPAELPMLNVLGAHTLLETGRGSGYFVNEALILLVRAAREDPDTFYRLAQARREPGSSQPLAAYFGDYRDGRSSTLERQMLQYVRLASGNDPTVGTLVLQAYCAWTLDDLTRASRALDEAEKVLRDYPDSQLAESWGPLIAALRYAL